jgi:hypothetical protein
MLRACVSAVVLLLATVLVPSRASVSSSDARLDVLGEAVENCLLSAVGPTVITFQRSASVEPCRQAERELLDFQGIANRNRQLGCSGSLVDLQTDLLLIGIHGGTSELAEKALGRIPSLQRLCVHMDIYR